MTPAADQYQGPAIGTAVHAHGGPAYGGALPFTGLDLGLLVLVAFIVTVIGMGLTLMGRPS